VPENTTFLDAVFASDTGPTADEPTGAWEYPQTVGLYERDAGILWTRTDPTTAERDTRFGRELVATWNAWIGNYIYGFDYVFGQDGSLEVRVTLTGTVLARGGDGTPEASAPVVGVDAHGVQTLAPNHQHFFSFRLDLDVDGEANVVAQSDVGPVAVAGFANGFAATHKHVGEEGFRDLDHSSARSWEVQSATRRNAAGGATAYEVHPGESAVPYSTDAFPALERAQFAKHAFWVTRYREGELYAAGQHPNQGAAGEGLPAFVDPPEPLPESGEDVVVWYTLGHTHVPRLEDHPVMPSATIHFELVPHGFFDRNPALDVPDQAAGGEEEAAALARRPRG
jgi:primary-amine oxidase